MQEESFYYFRCGLHLFRCVFAFSGCTKGSMSCKGRVSAFSGVVFTFLGALFAFSGCSGGSMNREGRVHTSSGGVYRFLGEISPFLGMFLPF